MKVTMEWDGALMDVTYHIKGAGFGPSAVSLNGSDLPFTRSANPYRTGAAEIPMGAVRERLTAGTNRLTVQLG